MPQKPRTLEQEALDTLVLANRMQAVEMAETSLALCMTLRNEVENPGTNAGLTLCSEKENAVVVLAKLAQVLQRLVAVEAALKGKASDRKEEGEERLLRTPEDISIMDDYDERTGRRT